MPATELDSDDHYDLGGARSLFRSILWEGVFLSGWVSRALSVQRTPPCQPSARVFYNYLA